MSDEKASHKYRTEIPNFIDDLDLSPFAYRLYGRIKRVCGDLGVCRDGTRDLAEACRMSTAQVSRAKRELVKLGLIDVRNRKRRGERDVIKIANVWRRNLETFTGSQTTEARFVEQPVEHAPKPTPAPVESVSPSNTPAEESVTTRDRVLLPVTECYYQ
ncbi:MAG: helix-turn-helix domain-containing protein [Acidobacteriota bacterium]|nr:helix-turn-helix domain-containing protein [Acidobacteriota bacterium]